MKKLALTVGTLAACTLLAACASESPTLSSAARPVSVSANMGLFATSLFGVAKDAVQFVAPGAGGPGMLTFTLNATNGQARSVQYMARNKTFADIKSFTFLLVDDTATGTVKYSFNYDNPKASGQTYTVSNLAAPDHLAIEVVAYDGLGSTGNIINKNRWLDTSGTVNLADQTVQTTTVPVALKDGYDANGDVTATVNITDGATASLVPTIQ